MSTSRPLLEPHPEPDDSARLRREIIGLEKELADAKAEAMQAKQASADAIHSIRGLRKVLEPLNTAMKMIFGEISRVDAGEIQATTDGGSSSLSPRWEVLKKRLGLRQAEIIDILQHGPMTSMQISAALHWDLRTTQKHISAMKVAGFVSKNGDQFSLRES